MSWTSFQTKHRLTTIIDGQGFDQQAYTNMKVEMSICVADAADIQPSTTPIPDADLSHLSTRNLFSSRSRTIHIVLHPLHDLLQAPK